MESAKKMNVINVTALPVAPLDERVVVSTKARKIMESALRKQMKDRLPTCIIGSMSQVNKKIPEVDLSSSVVVDPLAIEEYELEKKSLKEKTHGSPGDRVRRPKEEPPIICKGSELRTAKTIQPKRKTADKNLLAELYQHPPFDEDKPNKLPNGVDFCDMVGNVIRSEKNPLSGKSLCSDRELEKFLCSPSPRIMWLDSFWWIFHERYQPNKEIQNKLFDRIAQSYTILLFKMSRSHYEEALIKRLPSLLSKALYTSFCCCFPQSWFNTHEFKSEICNTMDLWISGTYPCPQSYDNWDYSELDPERFWREELILQNSRCLKGRDFSIIFACKRISTQSKNKKLQHLPFIYNSREKLKEADRRGEPAVLSHHKRTPQINPGLQETHPASQEDIGIPSMCEFASEEDVQVYMEEKVTEVELQEKDTQSHPAHISPKMTVNQFNLNGKSPLIVYFFLNYTTLPMHGQDVLVSRREKTEIIPDSTLTYADIIQLVTKNMERRKKKLKQLYRLHEDEWNCFNNYLAELKENVKREMRIINQKAAEKRKANHIFLSPSLMFQSLYYKKYKENVHVETAFLSRKEKKDVHEKQKFLPSPSLLTNTTDNYSLGLKNPYRIESMASTSKSNSNWKSKFEQNMLFRLSPSSME